MKKNILRHITVEGFAHSSDLSNCELLEKEFNEAKGRFKIAKKELKIAKKKLNGALDEIITEIESKKKEAQNNLDDNSDSSSVFNSENIKSKHEETIVELEVMKDKIKTKVEEYNTKGTENWDSFKHKLNHDLEELGIALKSFVTKSK
ncbi:hypothetical protein [Labilibaculum antarcticum]|uniref:Uncharacterized protein n=1 Tax=Labilibaculum antarcticum TaxID=1717717 RepID=A0A1Y1CLD9_9BACT|nr:hypothetical protein [Labilibaculum antarcticum]BAX81229.1 hypothetical protein ALGA_2924 [Labilibaculum antarcticum]